MSSLLSALGHYLIPDWNFEYACCREANLLFNILYGFFFVINTLAFMLYTYVFTRNKTLHANFRVILLILAFNDMALIYHRIADFWLTGRIDRETGVTYFIKMNCWCILFASLCNLIGERSFSLYAYRWYHDEYRRAPTVIIIVYGVQEIIIICLIQSRSVPKRTIVHGLTLVIFCSFIFLIAVYRTSRRRHRKIIALRFQWSDGDSLSRRHRTMEIIRESRLLQFFLPYFLFSTLLQLLLGITVLHFVVSLDHRYYLITHAFIYLTIAVRVFFNLLIPIIAHPAIKADAKNTVISLINKFRSGLRIRELNVTTSPTHRRVSISVHATDGQRLSFSPEEERDIYFAGYQKLW